MRCYYKVASMLVNEGYLGISKNIAFIQTTYVWPTIYET